MLWDMGTPNIDSSVHKLLVAHLYITHIMHNTVDTAVRFHMLFLSLLYDQFSALRVCIYS